MNIAVNSSLYNVNNVFSLPHCEQTSTGLGEKPKWLSRARSEGAPSPLGVIFFVCVDMSWLFLRYGFQRHHHRLLKGFQFSSLECEMRLFPKVRPWFGKEFATIRSGMLSCYQWVQKFSAPVNTFRLTRTEFITTQSNNISFIFKLILRSLNIVLWPPEWGNTIFVPSKYLNTQIPF